MSTALQRRGGTTAEHATFTGAPREITVDTDTNTVVVHDGATAGGHPLAKASDVTSRLPIFPANAIPTEDIGPIDVVGKGRMEFSAGEYRLAPLATETAPGYAQEATTAEINAGTGAGKFVTALKMFAGHIKLMGGAGYVKLPNWLGGLMLQWGGGNFTFNDNSVTFPIAFPNAAYGAVASGIHTNLPICVRLLSNIGTSGMSLHGRDMAGGGAVPSWTNWLAWGR